MWACSVFSDSELLSGPGAVGSCFCFVVGLFD